MDDHALCREHIQREIERLRQELTAATRALIISQTDGLRTQLERLEEETEATRSEVTVTQNGLERLQRDVSEIKDRLPSAELMLDIKNIITAAKETKSVTRTAIITALAGGGMLALWEGVKAALRH